MSQEPEKLWTKNFVLIMVINFFVFLNHLMILSTFPFYIEHLEGTEAIAGIAAAVFAFVAVVFRPFIGWVLDTGKRRIILVLGLIGMGLMPLGYMSVGIIVSALVCRMVHGFSLACANTASNTIASDLLPRSRFGEGMGYFGTSIALATAGAPALGLFLMNRWGFPALFVFSSVICFVSLVMLAAMKLPVIEMKKVKFEVSSLFDANALPASVTLFVFLLTFGALENFLAKFAAEAGLPSGGVFFAVMALVLLIVRMTTGKTVDRYGEGLFIYTCNLAMFIALLLLAFVPNTVTYLLSAALVGYGFGGIAPALQAVAVFLAPPERRGAANSTYLCAYDLGFGFGAGIAGGLITAMGYSSMFALLSVANVASVLLYVFWGSKHPSSFSYRKKAAREKEQGAASLEPASVKNS